MIKTTYGPSCQHTNGEKVEAFRGGRTTARTSPPFSALCRTALLTHKVRNKIKGIQIGKEKTKLSLLTEDTTISAENANTATQSPRELSDRSHTAEYEVNTQHTAKRNKSRHLTPPDSKIYRKATVVEAVWRGVGSVGDSTGQCISGTEESRRSHTDTPNGPSTQEHAQCGGETVCSTDGAKRQDTRSKDTDSNVSQP